MAVLWFLNTFNPCVVLTTAPTERQVKELLWREIRYAHKRSLSNLPGKITTLKLDISEKHYALGFSTDDINRIAGFHGVRLLYVIDEANGFPEELFEAVDGVLSGQDSKLVMFSNPINPVGRFFESFRDGKTKTYTLSCLDHPNVVSGKNIVPGAVTKKWVEDAEK